MKKIFFMLLAVFLIISCDNSTTNSEKLPIGEMESTMQTIYCEKFMECNTNFLSMMFKTTQECIDFFKEEGTMDYSKIVAKVNSGAVKYDAVKAATCIEAIEERGCKIFDLPSPDICEGTFEGTIEDGGECTIDSECISRYCDIQDGCPGKCTPPGEVGATCNAGESSCVHGADCNGEKCVDFTGIIADGESCDEAFQWCSENSYCMDGKCKPKLKEGENCELYQEACAKGMFCSPEKDNNVCVVAKLVEENGAECNPTKGTFCNALKDLYCNLNYKTYEGTCGAAKKEGEDCIDTAEEMYYTCEEGTYCKIEVTKGTCTKLLAVGETCTTDNECESQYCDEGKCTEEITECE